MIFRAEFLKRKGEKQNIFLALERALSMDASLGVCALCVVEIIILKRRPRACYLMCYRTATRSLHHACVWTPNCLELLTQQCVIMVVGTRCSYSSVFIILWEVNSWVYNAWYAQHPSLWHSEIFAALLCEGYVQGGCAYGASPNSCP